MEEKLKSAARTALVRCLAVQPGERVLVVTDSCLKDLGRVFFQSARELETEALLMEMLPRNYSGEEPPQAVAAAMQEADVILLVTEKSLSHTRARKKANEAGARAASLPGLTADMMARTLNADYQVIETLSLRLTEILTRGKTARLTSPAGTEMFFNLQGRSGQPDTGIYHQKGVFGNLPAGEAYIAPLEKTCQGILVFDGSMAGVGKLADPITIKVEDGYAVEISGGADARKLEELVNQNGSKARNIAELGIGTNHQAKLTGLVLEDEKVLGTVHVALGDNHTIGGVVEVPSHLDGIILHPTLKVDDYIILKDGKLVG